jgi:hypothetical protein
MTLWCTTWSGPSVQWLAATGGLSSRVWYETVAHETDEISAAIAKNARWQPATYGQAVTELEIKF